VIRPIPAIAGALRLLVSTEGERSGGRNVFASYAVSPPTGP
jgi:hypothetical protein